MGDPGLRWTREWGGVDLHIIYTYMKFSKNKLNLKNYVDITYLI